MSFCIIHSAQVPCDSINTLHVSVWIISGTGLYRLLIGMLQDSQRSEECFDANIALFYELHCR